jgi:predicted ABC-type transport system involved in lysophospholipase L1 biosynthesis ATPase subunit
VALLSLEGVGKRYRQGRREVVVLDDVWLEVDASDHVGVLAERRGGKSTLLRLAAGIELADTGVVRFRGRDLAKLSRIERARLLRDEIGFVATSLDGWDGSRGMRVVEHVAVPLLADGWNGREAVQMARPVLERVGAEHCADLRPSELSLGERTRVAIARALIREPGLLLVDEPAATPSPGEQDEIRGLLRSVGRASEVTLIVASEEPAVLRGARRMMSLSDGRVLTTDRLGTVVAFPDAGRCGESSARDA